MWKISQAKNPRRVEVAFPYNKRWVDLVKTIPDRRWNKGRKVWSFPVSQIRLVTQSLEYNKVPFSVENEKIAALVEQEKKHEQTLLAIKSGEVSAFSVPGLTTTPKSYQYKGILFLATVKGGILADEMGLGKTLQSLGASLLAQASPVLIVCKASTKWHWENEIRKHTELSSSLIDGSKKKRLVQWEKDAHFFICNYETVRIDLEEILKKKFAVIIADETTKIKNSRTQVSEAIKAVPATYRFALSGTPVENDLSELHSIADWCQPEILGSAWYFNERYGIKDWYGKISGWKPEGVAEVKKIVAPYVLRRLKKDELPNLPPKIEYLRVVEFTTAERREYRALVKEVLEELQANLNAGMTVVLRCKQFTSSPLVLGYEWEGPKIRELDDILEEGKGLHRFLVFSEFAKIGRILADRYKAPLITGETKQSKRQEILNEFNNSDTPVLFSSDAMAYGVEITGADTVIHLDTPWNPAVKDQREDRSHRPGQTRSVNVIRMMVRRTVDDRIDRVLARKLNLRNQLLDNIDYMKVPRFTHSDWRDILDDDGDEDSN